MPTKLNDWSILPALIAGVVLAFMIEWNSQLAQHSSPLFASWTAHGVGSIASLMLVKLVSGAGAKEGGNTGGTRWPLWSYLGGIPGAFTVLLAAISVNSDLGLSGTLALMLLGQMAFGLVADRFALFRLERRQPHLREAFGIALVLAGSIVVILIRS